GTPTTRRRPRPRASRACALPPRRPCAFSPPCRSPSRSAPPLTAAPRASSPTRAACPPAPISALRVVSRTNCGCRYRQQPLAL
ncbi:hypothetical protein HK405_005561, partial [Cladochytrium tenue]